MSCLCVDVEKQQSAPAVRPERKAIKKEGGGKLDGYQTTALVSYNRFGQSKTIGMTTSLQGLTSWQR